jgi:hypothetical protein
MAHWSTAAELPAASALRLVRSDKLLDRLPSARSLGSAGSAYQQLTPEPPVQANWCSRQFTAATATRKMLTCLA